MVASHPSPSADSRPEGEARVEFVGAGAQSSGPPHQSEELMRRTDDEGTLHILRRCSFCPATAPVES